ncbi:hypothetical protein B0T22DRAFT_250491 [Podospora appendiculata]|uniref:Glutamyl-tRNA amidotransferase complex subunit Gta3 domain-containing protein n=1 Tax=Podospora appendiculata TaxID=314037 RepID=A0AAE0X2H4_9PEZI|nr:hypothetical protein B0T22DRAFT_250491 [Podospora appendiculata]
MAKPPFICHSCSRAARRAFSYPARRQPFSSSPPAQTDLATLLSKPTWSVRSLLADSPSTPESTIKTPTITSAQLHHLLRLSALPPPPTPSAEAAMLSTLQSQLHFVRDIQAVDTSGVEPLRSIRDETDAGLQEATIGLEQVREALDSEDVFGHCRRPRRRKHVKVDAKEAEDWDVLGTASQTAGGGKYFVVRSGKGAEKSILGEGGS